MISSMESLPVELVDAVILYLPLADRQALRLVSKHLYSLTLTTFTTDYFSKRTTTLGSPSLKRLVAASAHSRFSNSVTVLDVKLLNYEDYENLRRIDRVGIYPPPKRLPKVPQVKTQDISLECRLFDYMRNHHDAKAVVHPLSRALKGFPNLDSIRIRVNGLTLYGNPYINADDKVYQDFLSACFKAVLDALVRSGVKLRHFTSIKGTAIRPISKSANLIYPAFAFSFPYLLSLQTAFASLKSLRLSIRTNYNRNARVPGWENGVSQFISAAPALEEFALCLQARDSEPWFRAAVMQSICRSVELPALKILQLYGCVVDELDMTAFFKRHTALRHISISDTELRSGTWASIMSLFKQDLDLEYLRFQYLQQSATPRAVQWGEEEKRSKLTIDARKSRHSDFMITKLSQAIATLAAAMEAHKVPEEV
ncbi:hypothetical protein BU23DRAFT_448037 [Bimuria novae-zelandiae CBS 107.79]|uniref:F-box domain-containing protein n=1 Tax=Bimuria novae-zelandiae CBS 107.79 TaxID=1447943 RepID=A0A6A5VNM2_9PLEO|nr:hypothetical protein BU23DRAFT_448037 [Bimuria novae-zelandiae CBS 107.79]